MAVNGVLQTNGRALQSQESTFISNRLSHKATRSDVKTFVFSGQFLNIVLQVFLSSFFLSLLVRTENKLKRTAPFSESQWGQKQYWFSLTLIVQTNSFSHNILFQDALKMSAVSRQFMVSFDFMLTHAHFALFILCLICTMLISHSFNTQIILAC